MNSLRRILLATNVFPKIILRRDLTSNPAENTNNVLSNGKKILVEHFNSITTIGINRPEKKNCLDVATAEELSEELSNFEKDENSAVGVLYGLGGNFCAGYDLEEIAQYNEEKESALPQFGSLRNRTCLPTKPLIGVMSGYTVGIGLELCLMCDLRVMESNALTGFLNRRFGVPILFGGTVRLPALIGYSRAMDMILTGRLVNADEAFQWGLANRLVACGTGLGKAVNWARSFVKFPQKTLNADRSSAQYATFIATQVEEAMQFEIDNASHLIFEEGVEGAKKFVHEGIGKHGKFHNLTPRNEEITELDKDLL